MNEKIRESIVKECKRKNITQKELLQRAELGSQFMQSIKTHKLLAENLIKIADVLDVSIDYLTGRTDNSKSHKL